MSKEKRSNNWGKRGAKESQPVTRRQFLKEASLVVGGAAIASLAFSSACGTPDNTATSGTTTTTTTPTTTTATTPSTTINTTTTTTTTTTSASTSTGTWSGVYSTPAEKPEMLRVPGCEVKVAADRLYVYEHMWVKPITDDIVVIGITEKFLEFLEVVYFFTLQDDGKMVYRDLYLGSVEASKMNVELIAPVSGTVLQNNDEIAADPESTINKSPYVKGWMQVIQLSNPEELEELLTPEEYVSYNAKIIES